MRSRTTQVFGCAVFTLAVCPFAIAAGEADRVLRISLPEQARPDVRDAQQRIYRATMNQARYLLGRVHPWSEDPKLLLVTDSRSGEHWIRPNTGAIEGFAFLVRFGPYDEEIVGVSREKLLAETIVPMMRYVVATHKTGTRTTGDGKPWGDAWQSAHWAQMLGRAAWWLWDDLPDDLREGVRRVVAHEAARFVDAVPPHQIRRDTKAEENAWNSQIFSVAVLLMPDDPRRPEWEKAFQRWVMSSFLRPSDERSEAIVDGRPVREQFTGANIYDDFTLENHGFVHPDYMTTFSLSLGCVLDYRMTGREPPEACWYNTAGIYENLKWFTLPDGGFVYPNGQDWRLLRNADWLHVHLLMTVFGGDGDAWSLAGRSLATLETMQARSDTGAIYLPEEYFFPSTQTDRLRSLAHSWLVLQVAEKIADEPKRRLGVRRLDAGKVILNRTPTAVHTFAWGAGVMAQCVPYRMDRIVSPHPRNGIGYVRLEGADRPLPVKVDDVEVTHGDDRFRVKLVLDHGENKVRALLEYESKADGTFTFREKLVALGDVTTTEIATGLVGILNNPKWIYETGKREIALDGKRHVVPALSGKTVEADVETVVIDGVLEIEASKPLRMRYVSASRYERARVTDLLFLNWSRETASWKKGAVLSQFEAIFRCAK
jgi:hypothetical protein